MTTSKKITSIVLSTFAIVLSAMVYVNGSVDARGRDREREREDRKPKKELYVELLPTDVSKPCPTLTLKGYADRDITVVRTTGWFGKEFRGETYTFEKGENWQVEATRLDKKSTIQVRVYIYNKNGKLILEKTDMYTPGAGMCAQN
jgi:hypothetical protein